MESRGVVDALKGEPRLTALQSLAILECQANQDRAKSSKTIKYVRESLHEDEYRETRKQVSENEKSKEGSACSNRPRYAAVVRVPHHSLAFYIASATPLLSA